ncbi:beta-1,4-glucuronyltransferase 1 isoform X2 [Daktulosphaira vitifoliae]|uniref:beta-1,4-glucuronyltransferase 1 isoform X2 n=1 Tax=Daktulosphaira vitifoliae TaxID=58002 RepID=UPI0021AA7B69|nr:beta-1,4-glucuronyltransferase 1 isoform X2 [Daktulosphaira vitifoliae]
MIFFKNCVFYRNPVLIYVVFIIMLYNIYLTVYLLNLISNYKQTCVTEDNSNISYFHFSLSNAEKETNGMVCLATQCSLDRLFSIVELVENWNGPISAAVYAAGEELYFVQDYIKFLRRCYTTIRNSVTFHLAVPANRFPESPSSSHFTDNLLCNQDPKKVLLSLLKQLPKNLKRWRTRMPYPQNHLRNLARFNCQAYYSLVTDIDIIPSYNSAEVLNDFLSTLPKCLKCVYVLPTYEIHQLAPSPKSFLQLMTLKNTGQAKYFHEDIFKLNQLPTNFDLYENMSLKNSDVHISHQIPKYQLFYEPFYISLNNVPSYDERFIGYGFTRNSQIYEMFAANYQFEVLANIFTFQHTYASLVKNSNYREIQYGENFALFTKFKHEIAARYALSHIL